VQIPQDIIDRIRDQADIVDVVSRFVELKRMGSNHKGLCPFHEEKTPSFNVNSDRQIFHCFGCGVGGNVFTFLMEVEGVSFPEAVRSLGKRYGIEVPDRSRADDTQSQTEGLYRLCDFAARWFHRNLMDKRTGASARAYLEKRGIPETAWRTFQIGYAPERWDAFCVAARRKRVPMEDLKTLKLIITGEKGQYDYFRSRVIFPIPLLSGRVVGFGGRALGKGVEPKYLNSVESPIYAKRRILYGLPQAREAIRAKRRAILVEGYTDCISLHVAGFENVVASCGTAMTAEHASLMRRLTREIVLLPDADAAGLDAALASGSIFLSAGFDVRVAVLAEGMDPDGAVRELGPEKVGEILGGAMEYLQYLDYIIKARPMSPRAKEAMIERVMAGMADAGAPLRYDVILQDLARIVGVSADSLRRHRGVPRKCPAPAEGGRTPGTPNVKRAELEKMLLRLLLESTPEVAEAREKLDVDDFSHGKSRELYKLLDSAWENHIDIRSSQFQKKAEVADLEGFAAEVSLIPIPPGNPGTLLKDTVRRVKELQIRDELNVLREKLLELPEESEEAVAVAEHYARLKRALSEL
jgi:DNA primase